VQGLRTFLRAETLIPLIVILVVALLVSCASLWMASRNARALRSRLQDVESKHEEFLEQAQHGHAIQRKIEAQLFEKQQRLDRLAHHDQLTGLPNRLFLAAHLPLAMEESRKTRVPLAVLFLDLDRFKHINDTHGHEVGDKLLQEVAQRIRSSVRTDDIVVRMGGDEFVVILSKVKSLDQANETAARIVASLSVPLVIADKPMVTTVSIGLSVFPRDGEDVGALLRHSDTAMYQAKDRGRNNFQVFSPVMDRKLHERVNLEARLRAALEIGQFDVHYQPIVDIETRRVVALEALVRWKDAEEGFIPPARFLPVAEESGLIDPIGQFVWRHVAQDIARWREQKLALLPVAVNVSPVQLQRSDLPAIIAEVTQAHGIEPSMLQIELTEGAMLEKTDRHSGKSSETTINELRALGVRISIDDFGTGYSSLGYLKQLRVDNLKIDRSFIRDLVSDSNDHAIVSAIVAMAKHLRIGIIVEGVEGWPQLEMLRKLGCRYAQGFLLAEPTAAENCAPFLGNKPLRLHDAGVDVLESIALPPRISAM
jgi:diguanylate cyclase (GGDEF)-like protein